MRQFSLLLLLALAFAPAAMARGGADLSVSASAPGVAGIGDDVTATVKVRNHGPSTANGVRLTDVLQGSYAFVSATPSRGSCSVAGNVVVCSLGSLRKDTSVDVDVTLEALDGGDLRNVFSVRSARRADPRPANNDAATRTSVPYPTCTIIGTPGNDRLRGTPADDAVCGLSGNDVVLGLDGDDTLYGGSGNDRLAGAGGNDEVFGEAGADTVDYRRASGFVRANLRRGTASGAGTDALSGVERLLGSRYGDVLRGSKVANRLSGGAGADLLYGLGGRDRLLGQRGNDRLDGGRGRDTLRGGRGRDRCVDSGRFC
jgi:uncharacterized repeat protein (TIGR01451 family)